MLQLWTCVELARGWLQFADQTAEALAGGLRFACFEVDEPAADAVAVGAPGVLVDSMRVVDGQASVFGVPTGKREHQRLEDGGDRAGVFDPCLRIGGPELECPVTEMR